MEFVIYKIGKTAKEYKHLEEKFITFLQPNKVRTVIVPASKKKQIDEKIQQETEQLLQRVNAHEPVIILSEKGKSMESPEFARVIDEVGTKTGRIQIIIGGAFGFKHEVLPAQYHKVSVSKLTFPHDLAYTVLLEQLYRAVTINKGKQYHY